MALAGQFDSWDPALSMSVRLRVEGDFQHDVVLLRQFDWHCERMSVRDGE
jgi:hypothetical protein